VGALVPSEQFNRGYEELLEFADVLEQEILALIHTRRASQELGRDVLSNLVRTHDEEGNLSDEELVGQATVLLSAAHMTTAHSLTWSLFLLAQHPTIMSALWDELQTGRPPGSFVGTDSQPGVPRPDGTLPKGEDLTLLDRVIKESMRILPASAYSQRVNMVEATIGPLHLQRGTGIVFTPIITHRLPELYPQPDRFLPDRWIGFQPNPYAYIPFGGGPRLCIGGPLATAIVRIALRQILSQYRLTVSPGAEINAHIESTMLVPTNGMPMRIDLADGQFECSPISGNLLELVDLTEAPIFAAGQDEFSASSDSHVPRKPR
jgi:cytochrome P450